MSPAANPQTTSPASDGPAPATASTEGIRTSNGSSGPITVSLVNDYEIILRGLHSMLLPYSDRVRVVETEVGDTPDHFVDVALFDTFAGRRDSLSRADRIVDEGRAGKVVLYTWDASPGFLDAARDVGAAAVVLKSVTGDELVRAIERVAAGDRLGLEHVARSARSVNGETLSNREREVLALLALGLTNQSIADELFLSIDTVKTYVRRLFEKLGVNNRTQAALMAAGYDLAPPEQRRQRISGNGDS